ncbi:MAG: hypothetical protein WDN49_14185 [Acetobacteraceae bacterium]
MAKDKTTDVSSGLTEGLLSSGLVRLFGRPFTGLTVGDLGGGGSSNPLAAALRNAVEAGAPPTLARIYGFSYLGNYCKLAEPLVFLVFGEGQPVPSGDKASSLGIDMLGIELTDASFTVGVSMWHVDQLDMAVRIDIRVGWVKDVLLTEIGNDGSRSDLVGRDGNLVGRDGNLVGRDGNLIGRGR